MNLGANHVLCMEVTYKTMEDNSRNTSLIGEVENSSRERALVAQRLETGFLTVRSRVRFPPGSVGAHCWRVPNRTKQLSSAPASFRLSTLLINDESKIPTNKLAAQWQIGVTCHHSIWKITVAWKLKRISGSEWGSMTINNILLNAWIT